MRCHDSRAQVTYLQLAASRSKKFDVSERAWRQSHRLSQWCNRQSPRQLALLACLLACRKSKMVSTRRRCDWNTQYETAGRAVVGTRRRPAGQWKVPRSLRQLDEKILMTARGKHGHPAAARLSKKSCPTACRAINLRGGGGVRPDNTGGSSNTQAVAEAVARQVNEWAVGRF